MKSTNRQNIQRFPEDVRDQIQYKIHQEFYSYDIPYQHYYKLIRIFSKVHIDLERTYPALKEIAKIIKKCENSVTRQHVEQICTLLFTDKQLVTLYYQSIPTADMPFMDRLIWEDFVSYAEARAIYKKDLIRSDGPEDLDPELLAEFAWLQEFMSTQDFDYEEEEEDDYDDDDYYMDEDFEEEGDFFDFDDELEEFFDEMDEAEPEDAPIEDNKSQADLNLHPNPSLQAGPGASKIEAVDHYKIEKIVRKCKLCFRMPLFMRLALSAVAETPADYTFNPVSIPEDYIIYQGEESIFQELPAIIFEISQEKIKTAHKHFLNIASLKRAQKRLGLHAFPDDTGYLKAFMLASQLTAGRPYEPTMDPMAVLNRIWEEQDPTPGMIDAALYLFEGIRKVGLYNINEYDFSLVKYAISQLPKNEWVTHTNIQKYVFIHNMELCNTFEDIVYELNLTEGSRLSDAYTHAGDIQRLHILKQQFTTGVILAAASFGLVDLAYAPDNPHLNLPVESKTGDGTFYACRLTSLGEYLLQDTTDYTPPKEAKPIGFALDVHHLTIKVDGKMELAESILRDWTKKVPGNNQLLQLDIETILSGCDNRRDLIETIEEFCKTISIELRDLPDYWKLQIMALIDRTQSIQSIAMAKVYQLSGQNKELQKLITQDPVLNKM